MNPIRSFFTTSDLSALQSGQDTSLRITAIEPDFVQRGPMSVQVVGRQNARAPEVYSNVVFFPQDAQESYEQIVVMKEQRRELRVKFMSDVINGDYQMGQIIAHIDQGDARQLA